MKSRVASSEIRINISNKQEVEISKKLEITIAIQKCGKYTKSRSFD